MLKVKWFEGVRRFIKSLMFLNIKQFLIIFFIYFLFIFVKYKMTGFNYESSPNYRYKFAKLDIL